MKPKTSLIRWLAALPLLVALACQLPSISLNRSPTPEAEQAQTWPRSNFVPPRQVLRVRVNEPLALESYHVSRVSRLAQLQTWVNDQPLKDEQTGEPTFPGQLATVQVLRQALPGHERTTIVSPSAFPSLTCQKLAQDGYPIQRTLLLKNSPAELEFPASAWTVCQVWIGFKPGTYDISLQATDERGRTGNLITQRIEVIEP